MVALENVWRGGSMGNAQEGDQLWKGESLLKIFDPSQMEVQALLGEPDGAVLTPGTTALVSLDAYILEKYASRARSVSAGIPEGITPHVLRHSKAMHLFQSGVPLVYIRDLLGHADIGTTEIYARADTEMKRKALESAYPELNSIALPDWNLDHGLLDWLNQL